MWRHGTKDIGWTNITYTWQTKDLTLAVRFTQDRFLEHIHIHNHIHQWGGQALVVSSSTEPRIIRLTAKEFLFKDLEDILTGSVNLPSLQVVYPRLQEVDPSLQVLTLGSTITLTTFLGTNLIPNLTTAQGHQAPTPCTKLILKLSLHIVKWILGDSWWCILGDESMEIGDPLASLNNIKHSTAFDSCKQRQELCNGMTIIADKIFSNFGTFSAHLLDQAFVISELCFRR